MLLTEACSDLYTLIEDAGGRGSDELDHFKELVMRAERMIGVFARGLNDTS